MAKHTAAVTKNWTHDQAREVLETWEKSGQSAAAFARSIGVVPQRLFWWRQRLGRPGPTGPSPGFVPIVVRTAEQVSAAPLVVTTTSGARIEVHDVDSSTAAWVVAVLGAGGRS